MGFGMKHRGGKSSQKYTSHGPISWLPVDSRLLTPFISFGHVKGFARMFLVIEIVLSVVVVMGTLVLAVFKLFNKF